ncbi:hypothetical protein COU14_03570 [Candidatus Kaiserbacteria bacterium CG10_big_fil_rev_8_21_14_0_10_44_10]|uniref:Uncharacterized protein n=1 Tax=Candidatus Kaiserbacteria bacterium CG10_big_fil_rev_8_21_14_0_10_44_10 TaxID=1974606 RepID=A0A2H0UGN9_9BACT|nr:MAG: hypothetical protein COU14_03570 [Candidatus Kaiserbacteria bacterium CG10_big_fil_rev_8_21_14_0_10_44_10]
MRDDNDIIFNEYSLDFFAFIDYVFVFLFGGGGAGSGGAGGGAISSWSPGAVFAWLSSWWSVFVVLSWLVSFLLIFGIIYAYIRHNQLGEVFAEILKRQEEAFAKIHKKDVKNLRWQDVLVHSDSERPNDWKLAIIEADIILDELLNTLGYAGTTIGEKLKSASPASFTTINQAWRAHNVRNKIAHEGADFNLSQKEARQTVAEYKMVFDEFDFI